MMKQHRTTVIAEAGVNHNGRLSMAKRLISEAKKAGADIIKFQTFSTEKIITRHAKKANYQKKLKPNESLYKMLLNLELSFKEFKILSRISKKKNIEFLSTGFDIESLKFLHTLKQKRFKIPSGEITNYPLLKFIAGLRKKVILSTGMSNLGEIDLALKVLTKFGTPLKDITVLHCNSAYTTPVKDANLNAMITMKKKFKVEVGLSDHTIGHEASISAVSLGAKIIEKHITLNNNMKGPDHKASLNPEKFKELVTKIRNVEILLGNYLKKPSKSELKNKKIVRKSIVAKNNIKKGEIFSDANIICKRPEGGISPIYWNNINGKKSKQNFKVDDFISLK